MKRKPKDKTPKFPDTIFVAERQYDDNPKRLVVHQEGIEPEPGYGRYQATYKLVGVELVTSKLVVTRKQVKP